MSFSYFGIYFNKNDKQCIYNDVYVSLLKLLRKKILIFISRFVFEKVRDIEIFENLFTFDVTNAPDNLYIELIDLQENNKYRNNFGANKLTLIFFKSTRI